MVWNVYKKLFATSEGRRGVCISLVGTGPVVGTVLVVQSLIISPIVFKPKLYKYLKDNFGLKINKEIHISLNDRFKVTLFKQVKYNYYLIFITSIVRTS